MSEQEIKAALQNALVFGFYWRDGDEHEQPVVRVDLLGDGVQVHGGIASPFDMAIHKAWKEKTPDANSMIIDWGDTDWRKGYPQ